MNEAVWNTPLDTLLPLIKERYSRASDDACLLVVLRAGGSERPVNYVPVR